MSKKEKDINEPKVAEEVKVSTLDNAIVDDKKEEVINKVDTKPMPVKATKEVVKEPVIYLGPTIYGVATKGTIYNNDLPKELKDAIKETPEIGALIVKLSESNFVRSEIKKSGSSYNIYYNSIK